MKSSMLRIACSALAVLLLVAPEDLEGQRRRRRPAPPKPDVATGSTLDERLRSLLNGRVASNSEASIQVAEVESGRVVAERNPHRALVPASNMKLFTTAAALDLLDDDFQVTTTVYARGGVDSGGVLSGDVKIEGRGDPSIGGRFHDGNSTAVIEQWVTDLKRAGIKTLLVSGGFTRITERLKLRLGLDYTHANTLEARDGKLTGRIAGRIVNADGKRDELIRVRAALGIDRARIIAFADSARVATARVRPNRQTT